MRWKLAIIVATVCVFLAAVTSAHSPIFLSNPTTGTREHPAIDDPEKSWAIYGRLPPGPSADVIPIRAEQGENLHLQLLIPDRPDLAEFRPQVVLIGPGLKGEVPQGSPVLASDSEGALTLATPARPAPLYEGFTQMHLLKLGTADRTFPETGRYLAVVYDPAERGGPYILALGTQEKFGPLDVLTFPLVWARARIWLWR